MKKSAQKGIEHLDQGEKGTGNQFCLPHEASGTLGWLVRFGAGGIHIPYPPHGSGSTPVDPTVYVGVRSIEIMQYVAPLQN